MFQFLKLSYQFRVLFKRTFPYYFRQNVASPIFLIYGPFSLPREIISFYEKNQNFTNMPICHNFFLKLIKLSEWGIFAKGVGYFLKLNTMTSHCEKFGYKIWRKITVTLFSWYAFSQNTNYYHFPWYSVALKYIYSFCGNIQDK